MLESSVVPADTDAARVFSMRKRSKLLMLIRRRYIDDRPVLIERIYLSPQRFPGLLDHSLDHSLSAVLEREYGVRTTHADVTMYPSILSGAVARQMHVSPSTPSLYISRICRCKNDQITEYNENFWHYNALKLTN